jgi:undecaprenyl-diphosphatase
MAEDPNAVTARNLSKDPVADPSLIEALPHDAEARLRGVIGDIGRLDRAVYGIIADTPTPSLDIPLRELSSLANHSKIWFAIAGGLALVGGETGRRAALAGVVSIGAASLVVNAVVKPFARRRRPDRDGEDVPEVREVAMPTSTSFPSGHSASAFAFASAVGKEIPAIGVPLRGLAGAVAYSRVHTGVHYSTDVIIGSIIGSSIGDITGALLRSRTR